MRRVGSAEPPVTLRTQENNFIQPTCFSLWPHQGLNGTSVSFSVTNTWLISRLALYLCLALPKQTLQVSSHVVHDDGGVKHYDTFVPCRSSTRFSSVGSRQSARLFSSCSVFMFVLKP